MVKAVLFDLWNTLAYFPSAASMSAEQERRFGKSISQKIQEIFVAGHVYPMQTEEFLEKIQTIAPLNESDKAFERSFFDLDDFTLYPDAIPILQWLKENGVATGLISNCTYSTRQQIADLGIVPYFDSIILSYEVGLMKPQVEIFKSALRDLKVSAPEARMVGDKLWQDMEGAKQGGIRGILLDRANTIDFAPKITSLLDLKEHLV